MGEASSDGGGLKRSVAASSVVTEVRSSRVESCAGGW